MEVYKTKGVCSSEIHFSIKDGKVDQVAFVNGCPGNTIGIAALIQGFTVEEAVERLKGIDCKGRGTSCPDQLAHALEHYIAGEAI